MELTEALLLETLRRHDWRVGPTAAALGLSRGALYDRIDKSDRIRKATDLTADEIEAARVRFGDDVEKMAESLEVSTRGLKLRIRALSKR